MAALILVTSCNMHGDKGLDEKLMDAEALEQIHDQIRFELQSVDAESVLKSLDADFEKELLANLEYTGEHGVGGLFDSKGVDKKFLEMAEIFEIMEDDAGVYSVLADNYEIKGVGEANFLFGMVELANIIEEEMIPEDNYSYLKSATGKIPLGCILAIAGTVAATAGAFALGPGGVAVWLAGKSIATASLILACTEKRQD